MHFNSRPHGGRPIFSDNLAFTSSFQLTPSRRATINLPPLALRSLISTHALTEGDLCSEIRKAETISFQLTPSRRATARPFLIQLTNWLNFNSRPHGGRLAYWQQFLRREHFNSRPHGGRRSRCLFLGLDRYFNSRPHGGRRAEKNSTWTAYYFNSRPHGGRRRDFCQLLIDLEFQLTPSRRATTHSGRSRSRSCNFNSRPHGGRPVHCPFSSGVLISTHALTEGDVTGKGQRYFVNISTHALTEGDICS